MSSSRQYGMNKEKGSKLAVAFLDYIEERAIHLCFMQLEVNLKVVWNGIQIF